MGWDPAVLRKYNTTGHFRLLNQVRTELKGNPLIRPKAGETVGAANRSRSLTRALEFRGQGGGYGRRSRAAASLPSTVATDALPAPRPTEGSESGSALSFRDRLNAIDMR